MKNSRENAEKFHWEYEIKNTPNWLSGVPDLVDYLTEYGSKLQNKYIPNDAHSFEVFAIKDSEDSPTGKQAFIGFKLDNGNFNFISVPYTEPLKVNMKNKVENIHNYLKKPKFRAIVLLPPLILCVIGAIVAFVHAYLNFGFTISTFVQWTYFGSVIWLLLSISLVFWSDYKQQKVK